jgi:hypothetical protein
VRWRRDSRRLERDTTRQQTTGADESGDGGQLCSRRPLFGKTWRHGLASESGISAASLTISAKARFVGLTARS